MNGTGARRTSWMLTFADLLSILLCFLVLAYALKAAPDGAQERALSALREVFRPGSAGLHGAPLQLSASQGGNYWATWLKARAGEFPALADNRITVHGATARFTLSSGPDSLAAAEAGGLARLLNGSGADVAIRAGAASDSAADWLEAARRAQSLSDRLRAAGLRQTPRIVVSGGGPRLAVEIGREEP